MVSLLTAVVGYVRIDDGMFDKVLELFGDLVWQRAELRATLDTVNSDAVWLIVQDLGKNRGLELPAMEGFTFARVDTALLV
jgi:uncharacterized protein YbjT (DUF2867 family)